MTYRSSFRGTPALIVVAALGLLLACERADSKIAGAQNKKDKKEKKEKKKDGKGKGAESDPGVTIAGRWDMPPELKEISGIAWIGEDRFACVQDELGKIFIFNTAANKVEKEIPFGGPGDYEGIAIAGNTAWVIRADGVLFEVGGYERTPSVRQHATSLTVKQNVEGVCYDKSNNRLLLAIKGAEPGNVAYKGIYAFDLASQKLAPNPVYKIDVTADASSGSKKKGVFQPSDLDIHPTTGDLYVLDGTSAKVMIIGRDGSRKKVYQLADSDFPQAEGISFTPAGELFISNEGPKGPGTILKVGIAGR